MSSLYAKELWALSPEAKDVLTAMVSAGYEHDLALAMLTKLCGDVIYTLEETHDGND